MHEPDRWYSEHESCIHPDLLSLPEPLSEEDEQIAADYESAYYDTHFTCDDDFESCEAAFDGIGCGLCSEQQDRFVPWPCEFGDVTLPLPQAWADDPPQVPAVTGG